MEKKQTAVDYLVQELIKQGFFKRLPVIAIQQAAQIEKEQRFEDFKEGFQAALESLQGANNLVQSKKLGGNNE
jgi:hypothetical protein